MQPTVILSMNKKTIDNHNMMTTIMNEMIGFKKQGATICFAVEGDAAQAKQFEEKIGKFYQTKNIFTQTMANGIDVTSMTAPLNTTLVINCGDPEKVAGLRKDGQANIVQITKQKSYFDISQDLKKGYETASVNAAKL